MIRLRTGVRAAVGLVAALLVARGGTRRSAVVHTQSWFGAFRGMVRVIAACATHIRWNGTFDTPSWFRAAGPPHQKILQDVLCMCTIFLLVPANQKSIGCAVVALKEAERSGFFLHVAQGRGLGHSAHLIRNVHNKHVVPARKVNRDWSQALSHQPRQIIACTATLRNSSSHVSNIAYIFQDAATGSGQFSASAAVLAQSKGQVLVPQGQSIHPPLMRIMKVANSFSEKLRQLGFDCSHDLQFSPCSSSLGAENGKAFDILVSRQRLTVNEENQSFPIFLQPTQRLSLISHYIADAIFWNWDQSNIVAGCWIDGNPSSFVAYLITQPAEVLSTSLTSGEGTCQKGHASNIFQNAAARLCQLSACRALLSKCIRQLILFQRHRVSAPLVPRVRVTQVRCVVPWEFRFDCSHHFQLGTTPAVQVSKNGKPFGSPHAVCAWALVITKKHECAPFLFASAQKVPLRSSDETDTIVRNCNHGEITIVMNFIHVDWPNPLRSH
mmetsp:Transcript_26568/g.88063  ORF Transcript_26568/g.88063 Transcript_26568/m.88063 type:complete len:497 (+) Transcript_26568:806-2296(+)